jgi:hypothetical protein
MKICVGINNLVRDMNNLVRDMRERRGTGITEKTTDAATPPRPRNSRRVENCSRRGFPPIFNP